MHVTTHADPALTLIFGVIDFSAALATIADATRSEPVAKYNQLMRIEQEPGDRARNAGRAAVAIG